MELADRRVFLFRYVAPLFSLVLLIVSHILLFLFPFFFAFDAISKVKHIAIEPGNEIKKDIFSFFALPLKSGILPGVEAPGRCATTPLIG